MGGNLGSICLRGLQPLQGSLVRGRSGLGLVWVSLGVSDLPVQNAATFGSMTSCFHQEGREDPTALFGEEEGDLYDLLSLEWSQMTNLQ